MPQLIRRLFFSCNPQTDGKSHPKRLKVKLHNYKIKITVHNKILKIAEMHIKTRRLTSRRQTKQLTHTQDKVTAEGSKSRSKCKLMLIALIINKPFLYRILNVLQFEFLIITGVRFHSLVAPTEKAFLIDRQICKIITCVSVPYLYEMKGIQHLFFSTQSTDHLDGQICTQMCLGRDLKYKIHQGRKRRHLSDLILDQIIIIIF